MGFYLEDLKKIILNDIDDSLEDHIKHEVLSHLEDQPHRITCRECGETLEVHSSLDFEMDIIMEVEPCKCILEE